MLCQSAPISPKSDDVCECMAFASVCAAPMGEELFNDVERRAGPVSPYNEPKATRSPVASSRRLRSRVSPRAAQRRSAHVRALDHERAGADSVRFRHPSQSRFSRRPQSNSAPTTRDSSRVGAGRRLRRRNLGPTGGSTGRVLGPEGRTRDADGSRKAASRGGLGRPSILARAALVIIRIYQRTISPNLGDVCRFSPSCSHYTYEAIEVHGLLKGSWLGLRRLVRCVPWGERGFDPVPE
jgi:putative membrane protein insertion efficiency factor